MLFNHYSWHYCNILEPSTNFFSHPIIDHHFTRVNLQMKGEVSLIVPSDWTKIWRQDLLPQSPWGSSAAGHCRRCLLQKSNIAIINNKRMKWAELLVGRIWDQYIEKSQKAVRLWNGRLGSEQSQMTGTPPWHKTPPASPTTGGGAKLPAHPTAPPASASALPACLGSWVLSPWGSILNLLVWRHCSLIFQPLSNLFHWKRSIAASFFTGQVLLP